MTPGRALLCLRELKSLEYQGFSGKKKMHGNSIKITVHWCCITPKRCLEVGKYSKMIRLINIK